MNKSYKNLLEFIPLIIFFVTYHKFGLIPATAAIIVTTLISLIVLYVKERTVSWMLVFSASILTIFGGLTVFSGNTVFIKMKPTILYSIFALILLSDIYFKRGFLRYILGKALTLSDAAWLKCSIHWSLFFVFCAATNEIIWRNFSESSWVAFKTFGMLPLMLIFTTCQLIYIQKKEIK